MVKGGAGVDGFCFFNCLEYLGDHYNCENDTSYATQYGQTYGFSGVLTGELDPNHMTEFVNSTFDTSTDITGNIDTQYIGFYKTGEKIGETGNVEEVNLHAVILTEYDEDSDTYSYYDPTEDATGSFGGSDFAGYYAVNGCK
jgi:hypothetical protein